WKLLLSSFLMIFIAELGDKTQLATFTLAAESKSPWLVFLGCGSALLLTTFLAVFFGDLITRFIPMHIMKYLAGIVFIGFGIMMFFGK
ncbi:MAG: TMEM165/GDT1 family protein, partial [bacterium]|nr:TMEM165/GDT1 family protein [bacterium]